MDGENTRTAADGKLDEMLELLRQNNEMLRRVQREIMRTNSDQAWLEQMGRAFGVGICSTIIGDRILGLGRTT